MPGKFYLIKNPGFPDTGLKKTGSGYEYVKCQKLTDTDEDLWRFQKSSNFRRFGYKDYQTYYIFNKKYWADRLFSSSYGLQTFVRQYHDELEFILVKERIWEFKIIDRNNQTFEQNTKRCGFHNRVNENNTETWKFVMEGTLKLTAERGIF